MQAITSTCDGSPQSVPQASVSRIGHVAGQVPTTQLRVTTTAAGLQHPGSNVLPTPPPSASDPFADASLAFQLQANVRQRSATTPSNVEGSQFKSPLLPETARERFPSEQPMMTTVSATYSPAQTSRAPPHLISPQSASTLMARQYHPGQHIPLQNIPSQSQIRRRHSDVQVTGAQASIHQAGHPTASRQSLHNMQTLRQPAPVTHVPSGSHQSHLVGARPTVPTPGFNPYVLQHGAAVQNQISPQYFVTHPSGQVRGVDPTGPYAVPLIRHAGDPSNFTGHNAASAGPSQPSNTRPRNNLPIGTPEDWLPHAQKILGSTRTALDHVLQISERKLSEELQQLAAVAYEREVRVARDAQSRAAQAFLQAQSAVRERDEQIQRLSTQIAQAEETEEQYRGHLRKAFQALGLVQQACKRDREKNQELCEENMVLREAVARYAPDRWKTVSDILGPRSRGYSLPSTGNQTAVKVENNERDLSGAIKRNYVRAPLTPTSPSLPQSKAENLESSSSFHTQLELLLEPPAETPLVKAAEIMEELAPILTRIARSNTRPPHHDSAAPENPTAEHVSTGALQEDRPSSRSTSVVPPTPSSSASTIVIADEHIPNLDTVVSGQPAEANGNLSGSSASDRVMKTELTAAQLIPETFPQPEVIDLTDMPECATPPCLQLDLGELKSSIVPEGTRKRTRDTNEEPLYEQSKKRRLAVPETLAEAHRNVVSSDGGLPPPATTEYALHSAPVGAESNISAYHRSVDENGHLTLDVDVAEVQPHDPFARISALITNAVTNAPPPHSAPSVQLDVEKPKAPQTIFTSSPDTPATPDRSMPKRDLGFRHLQLIYKESKTSDGKEIYICRLCTARRERVQSSVVPASFPRSATWDVLSGHINREHPASRDNVVQMSAQRLAETILRMKDR